MIISGVGKFITRQCFFAKCRRNTGYRFMHSKPEGKNSSELSEWIHKNTFTNRGQLKYTRRLVVKLGSNVITREDNHGIALGRLASIVEQVAECQLEGRECIMVTSGAVAFGKQRLAQELIMSSSLRDTIDQKDGSRQSAVGLLEARAAAAVGQSGLMSLYDAMFSQYGVQIAQVLVTEGDCNNEETRRNLFSTLSELISLNIVPIINTNDAVTPPPPDTTSHEGKKIISIKDNDALAAMLAAEVEADLLILISDVDGIYTHPPSHENSKMIWTYTPDMKDSITFGQKSNAGTGGMSSKVTAATYALDKGVPVVICNGMQEKSIKHILSGRKLGTFFTFCQPEPNTSVEILAKNARRGGRLLQSLTAEQRATAIYSLADLLINRQNEICDANAIDLEAAAKENLEKPLLSRLSINSAKLNALSKGLIQIAKSSHQNVGKVLRNTLLADGLELKQITVPIGVLLVIFESRPDCLPQVAALAMSSANGLLLKGGREATNTNKILMNLVKESLKTADPEAESAMSLVSTREEISDLLLLNDQIDLIIPRGSAELVKSIQERSNRIPVLGHSEGICHVYLHKDADLQKAIKIVTDSKCDYPAACNAMETLLVHEELLETPFFDVICNTLKNAGVKIYSGPKLREKLTFGPPPAKSMKTEYGTLECCIEMVTSLQHAIRHIHLYGSGHTEVIVTEQDEIAEIFQNQVDSACVFHNASSRFADGYRFGLGAEVGISTSRIHARGPVGVEGLLTTKWILSGNGHAVADFSENGPSTFIHRPLPIS